MKQERNYDKIDIDCFGKFQSLRAIIRYLDKHDRHNLKRLLRARNKDSKFIKEIVNSGLPQGLKTYILELHRDVRLTHPLIEYLPKVDRVINCPRLFRMYQKAACKDGIRRVMGQPTLEKKDNWRIKHK